MYLIYYDESGDDGFPRYSSSLFALSGIYIHDSNWRMGYDALKAFRKKIKKDYGFPTSMEMHTKYFLSNKNPFRELNIPLDYRVSIIDDYCETISKLPINIVNVVINKSVIRKQNYPVLDNALTYSIQRVDNTIKDGDERFLIITDEGRVHKMRRTTRKIQIFNPIPSKYDNGIFAQKPIGRLIEDPLPKASHHSFFVQTSDLVAFLVYNYMLQKIDGKKSFNRLKINNTKIIEWLEIIKPVLNLKASINNRFGYGIVCYPNS